MVHVVNLKAKGKMKLSRYSLAVYRKGMFEYGREFFNISRKTRRLPVKYYMLGHALELFLKSYLMKRGYSVKQLKSRHFSHNLARLLEESIDNGLENNIRISDSLRNEIVDFSDLYATKKFEYFPIMIWIFGRRKPETARILRFARQLNQKLPGILEDE